MARQDFMLVEARKARMVSHVGNGEPNRRVAHFLKPVGRFAHQTEGVASPYLAGCRRPGVRFKGWCCPLRGWADWVDKMEKLHGGVWDAAGIRGAIKASTCKVSRQHGVIWELVRRWWCPKTNTFVFPWGEATPTLEDMAVLGGFSLIGEPVTAKAPLASDLASMHERMVGEMRKFCRRPARKPLHTEWLRYYVEELGAGGDGELQHTAFLSLWLSRWVFPGPVVRQQVLPVAIRLARGSKVALAPAVLAAFYRDLGELKRHAATIAGSDGNDANAVVWSPFQLLQMWAWERFPSLRPTAGPNVLQPHEPWAARWHNLGPPPAASSLQKSILGVAGWEFQWRPYVADFDGCFRAPAFYQDAGRWVGRCSEGDEELLAFFRCLTPSELVGLDAVEQYLPHRVSMQLGFDQDIPATVRRANSCWELAWSTYDKPINNKVRFYVPSRSARPQVTLQFRRWWKLCMSPHRSRESSSKNRAGQLEGMRSKAYPQKPEHETASAGTEMKASVCSDSMRPSSWGDLKGRRATRKRTAPAALGHPVITPPQRKKQTFCPSTRTSENPALVQQQQVLLNPKLPESLASATKQPEDSPGGEPNPPASCRWEVNGGHGSLHHTGAVHELSSFGSPTTKQARAAHEDADINSEQAEATQVHLQAGAAASIIPGGSVCNPITIDDSEEMQQGMPEFQRGWTSETSSLRSTGSPESSPSCEASWVRPRQGPDTGEC